MRIQGARQVPAPPDAVWVALNDPEVMRRCIPGCEWVEVTSETERIVRFAITVGPVHARFAGRVVLRDVRPGQGCHVTFEGTGGAAGFARVESDLTLRAIAGNTVVFYALDACVGGLLGRLGEPLVEVAVRGLAHEFFDALAGQWKSTPSTSRSSAKTSVPAAPPGPVVDPARPGASG